MFCQGDAGKVSFELSSLLCRLRRLGIEECGVCFTRVLLNICYIFIDKREVLVT